MNDEPNASNNSCERLAERILQALDLLDNSLSQLPDSRGKTECIDLLIQLRFMATRTAREADDANVSRK